MLDKFFEWRDYDWKELHKKIFQIVSKPSIIILMVSLILGFALCFIPNFSNSNYPAGYIIDWAEDDYQVSSYLFCFVYFNFFKLNPFLGCYNHCFGAQLFLAVRLTKLFNREIIAKEDTYYVPNLQQIPNSKLPSPANHDLHGRSNNHAQ